MNEQELKLFDLLAIQIVLVRRVKMVFVRREGNPLGAGPVKFVAE